MKLSRETDSIRVDNGHWITRHDLKKGGALVEVIFKQGRHGNVLTAPLTMAHGEFADTNETTPTVRIEERPGQITVVFTGTLKDARGQGSLGYLQSWEYHDYGVRRLQQVFYGDAAYDPRRLVLNRFSVSDAYPNVQVIVDGNAWQDWRHGTGESFEYGSTPERFGFFAPTGEGLQFYRGDDLTWWGYDPATRQATHGTFSSRPFVSDLLPWGRLPAGADWPDREKGAISFDSFLGLTNYKSRPYLPYRELVIDSQPFPSDAEIHDLAAIGINVLRIHEGSNFVNRTGDCWLDGTFPPYEGPQLTEMKRMIRTAQAHGIKVIPYFMPGGVHPLSEAFRNGVNAREWQGREWPNSFTVFSALGDGQVWETYFCLASQWHNWLLDHVTRVLNEYGFDGFYFDGLAGNSCFHPAHGRVPHRCLADSLKLLTTLRQRFPDKIIFNHQMSNQASVILANIVDHVVNLEEYGLKTPAELRPLPFAVTVQRACASVGPVPQPWITKEGEPLSPQLALVKYKPGHEPKPTRELARRGLPYAIVHGLLPYLYTFMEKIPLGYRTPRDRVEDREGFYYFYRLLQVLDRYQIEEYYAPAEQVLTTDAAEVHTAVLRTAACCLVLCTSTAAKVLQNVSFRVSQEAAPALRPERWKSAAVISSTGPLGVSVKPRELWLDAVHPEELYIIEVK